LEYKKAPVPKLTKKQVFFRFFRLLRFIPDDIRCGFHSGFRVCDIIWYSFFWIPFYLVGSRYYSWCESKSRKSESEVNVAQYIECPLCLFLKPKVREIKRCNCSCKHGKNSYRVVRINPPAPEGAHVIGLDYKIRNKDCGRVFSVVFGYCTEVRADGPKMASILGSIQIKEYLENKK